MPDIIIIGFIMPMPIPMPPMPPIMPMYIWPANAARRSAEPMPNPPFDAFTLPLAFGACVAPTAYSL